jgi:prevent-host-death family protein
MQRISANFAKTNFGALLKDIRSGPVEIRRRGRPAAYLISPEAFREFVRLAYGEPLETLLAGIAAGTEAARSGKGLTAARIFRSLNRHFRDHGIR